MALGDWNLDLANVSAFLTTNSLSLDWSATMLAMITGTHRGFLSPTVASGYTRGVTEGTYRTLMRLENATANSTSIFAGILLMASAATVGTLGGNWYAVHKRGNNIDLRRGNSALVNLGTQLATAAHTVSTGALFSLEVEWAVVVGQVDFTVSAGSLADFSDLATIFTYSDTSGSRITTSVCEGIYTAGSGSPASQVTFDKTTLI